MAVFEINPLQDPRWRWLLEKHSRTSVFHTPEWLGALRSTYGYEPLVLTTATAGGELNNGMVFCHINSWLTGRRLVSLPFSDHCQPLASSVEDLEEIASWLAQQIARKKLKYVEIRPLEHSSLLPAGFKHSEKFVFHKVDLRYDSDTLLKNLHKDSIRRKIQRAEREGLTYEKGSSRALLEKFYPLFVMARKRHGLPPSPLRWFENLLQSLGEAAQIRIASRGERPVAGIFTLTCKKAIVYKYGGSDSRFNNLGGTPFLFWRTMQEAQEAGLEELDLGRTGINNEGLITFKRRLGGIESTLTYWRLPVRSASAPGTGRYFDLAKRLFAATPERVRIQLGNLLYRHLG